MSFDGEDDYIEIVESIEMSNSFAIQAKIKTHSLYGHQVIYANQTQILHQILVLKLHA